MKWDTIEITTEEGRQVMAQAPLVLSVSRATDIPAFYAEWFFYRLKQGYSVWKNPFNGVRYYIAYERVRVIVFWTKNPQPIFPYLHILEERGIHYYFQYTLNDYEAEGLEPGLPPLNQRIDTFRKCVERVGKGRVVWRFDPFILTDQMTVDVLLGKVEHIATQLLGYSNQLVFSFADIAQYKKVRNNLRRKGVNYREFDERQMKELAEKLSLLNRHWGYRLASCAESVDLSPFGIEKNKCIDDELMVNYFSEDTVLMDVLGVKIGQNGSCPFPSRQYLLRKDKGQRRCCGCVNSRDIGEYNTCPHLCLYCYANGSQEKVERNYRLHCASPQGETITG